MTRIYYFKSVKCGSASCLSDMRTVVSSFGTALILDLLADVDDDDEPTTGPATSCLIAAQMSGDKCPVDHAGPAQSSAAGCPVDHTAGSAWSKHLPHSSETLRTTPHIPNAPKLLSKDREVSSIPRADGDKWVYPSEAQFFAAMARKNHNPNAPDMRVVVPIHNAVNEVAWAHILKWEAGRGGESCGGPRLVSFKGRPGDLSPKARIRTLFGYTRPFDRHDWVVDRCGMRVRYVIDFYSGRNTQADSKVSFFLDVRPALDSWDAVKMTAGSLWDKWTSNLFRPTPGSRERNP